MVEAGFNELQYAYGCLRELEEGPAFGVGLGKPIFPSLREEAALGSDVLFRPDDWLFLPICFQFKVSDRLATRRAKEWYKFGRPYFRFYVWPASRSPQHNILVSLANRGYPAFYCAPCFCDWGEYQQHYAAGRLVENSSLAWCGQFPTITGYDWHSISYADAVMTGIWSSEPREVRIGHGRDGLEAGFRVPDLPFRPLAIVLRDLMTIYETPRPEVRLRTRVRPPQVSLEFVTVTVSARERFGQILGLVPKPSSPTES